MTLTSTKFALDKRLEKIGNLSLHFNQKTEEIKTLWNVCNKYMLMGKFFQKLFVLVLDKNKAAVS